MAKSELPPYPLTDLILPKQYLEISENLCLICFFFSCGKHNLCITIATRVGGGAIKGFAAPKCMVFEPFLSEI